MQWREKEKKDGKPLDSTLILKDKEEVHKVVEVLVLVFAPNLFFFLFPGPLVLTPLTRLNKHNK
jgi:hypothetical protein